MHDQQEIDRPKKASISADEVARRREMLRQADANNAIEGIFRPKETDAIFEACVRGEIELADVGPLLKAQLGIT